MNEECCVPLPEDEKLCWGEEPVEFVSPFRAQICLNGLWMFMPAEEGCQDLPHRGWGYIRVPGGWRNFIPWIPMPGIVAMGEGTTWDGFDGEKLEKGWYRRSIRVPAEWEGRSVLLKQERDVVDADVYVNGAFCGCFDYISDTVDITHAVAPGEEAAVVLLVRKGPGISGDVLLCARPRGAYIDDVFIKTSTRKWEMALDIELAAIEERGAVRIQARVLDEHGVEECRFEAEREVTPAERQMLPMVWEWNNPRLWDVGSPNLYTLQLRVNGCGLEDETVHTFGFREFWLEGRRFFLNGTEIRLRPVTGGETGNIELIDAALDGFLYSGFNFYENWPLKDNDANWSLWYDRADRKGMLISGAVGNMWSFLNDWDRPETKEAYRKRTLAEMKRVRNHPSIVLWGTNANVFGSGLGMDPRTLGMKKDHWYDRFYWRKRRAPAGEEGAAVMKAIDPTRGVFMHHGGGVGDVYTLNFYLNLTPLQEREEWLSHRRRYSDMPLMIVEFGTPLHVSFMRGRTDFGGAVHTEPLLTEFCAIYLGREAYRVETAEYRQKIREHFIDGQAYTSWHVKDYFDFAPAMQRVQALFSRNTYRSWRTMGITGGMIPWNDGHGWSTGPHSSERVALGGFKPGRRGWYLKEAEKDKFYRMRPEGCIVQPGGQAIVENNSATLAWIAGPVEALTAKDHHFRPGQKLCKQIVLLNDARRTLSYTYRWEAEVDGTVIASDRQEGEIATGSTLFFPLEFILPDTIQGEKVQGQIRLYVHMDCYEHRDTFGFRIYGVKASPVHKLCCYDPVGETAAMYQSMGYETEDWKGRTEADVVLVGRTVLSQGHPLPDGLETYVESGGRVVLFTQDPEWIRKNLGLRVAHHVSRRAFPVQEDHPVTTGLDAEDFRDWSGESGLIEAYPAYSPETTGCAKKGTSPSSFFAQSGTPLLPNFSLITPVYVNCVNPK